MTVLASDISIVLSGGVSNLNPNAALGGDPSPTTVGTGLNNLFSNVTSDEAGEGQTDYRCVYIFNDGDASVYNLRVYLLSEVEGGSTVEIGTTEADEIQRITILGNGGAAVTSGSVTFSYEGVSFVSTYNSDLAVWAAELEEDLNGLVDEDNLPLLQDCTVLAQNSNNSIIFDITFADRDGKRNHVNLTADSNTFLPSPATITNTAIRLGSPINTIAPEIDMATTAPGSVNFLIPTVDSPILLPRLGPSEGFPLWIKRITEAGATAVAADGVSIRIKMESLAP